MKAYPDTQDQSILTKNQLLSWLNSTLQVIQSLNEIKVSSIEELANGAAFCQLLDVISPGSVRMNKINWNAKLEHENLSNIKILVTAMMALGIEKKFDAVRVSQKKHMEILELLQWFRKYFQTTHRSKIDYDPIARRKTISTEKSLENKHTDENKKYKITSPISFPKPSLNEKANCEELSPENEIKHCFKAIKRIVTEESKESEENKLEKIKSLLFKSNTQGLTRETENPELSSEKTVKDYPNLPGFDAPIKFEDEHQEDKRPNHQMHLINSMNLHENIQSSIRKTQLEFESERKRIRSGLSNH